MTKTTNYQLNQWAKSDRVMMDDFNADNTKIDAALKANADAAAAASAAVALCGNCKIETSTYTGNGKYGSANPTTLTFPKKPSLVIVFGFNALILISDKNGHTAFTLSAHPTYGLVYRGDTLNILWENSTLQYYSDEASYQANCDNKIYQVVAFYAQDK